VQAPSKMLVASILEHLGHSVPDEAELENVIRDALRKVKTNQAQDPDAVMYKVTVPIDVEWIRQFADSAK
jgi:hypothetical protein